jgi:hypothetical protein
MYSLRELKLLREGRLGKAAWAATKHVVRNAPFYGGMAGSAAMHTMGHPDWGLPGFLGTTGNILMHQVIDRVKTGSMYNDDASSPNQKTTIQLKSHPEDRDPIRMQKDVRDDPNSKIASIRRGNLPFKVRGSLKRLKARLSRKKMNEGFVKKAAAGLGVLAVAGGLSAIHKHDLHRKALNRLTQAVQGTTPSANGKRKAADPTINYYNSRTPGNR